MPCRVVPLPPRIGSWPAPARYLADYIQRDPSVTGRLTTRWPDTACDELNGDQAGVSSPGISTAPSSTIENSQGASALSPVVLDALLILMDDQIAVQARKPAVRDHLLAPVGHCRGRREHLNHEEWTFLDVWIVVIDPKLHIVQDGAATERTSGFTQRRRDVENDDLMALARPRHSVNFAADIFVTDLTLLLERQVLVDGQEPTRFRRGIHYPRLRRSDTKYRNAHSEYTPRTTRSGTRDLGATAHLRGPSADDL